MNENLPKDPVMLLSFINLKLRDEFSSLEELCSTLNINRKELEETLKSSGFEYDQENNKFW